MTVTKKSTRVIQQWNISSDMASSSICETSGFKIQTMDIHVHNLPRGRHCIQCSSNWSLKILNKMNVLNPLSPSSVQDQNFWHQSEARMAATIWNWCGKTLSPGALLAVLYFSLCYIFFRPFRLFLVPTICLWVSQDDNVRASQVCEGSTQFL